MLLSYPDYEDFAARNRTFEHLGAFRASNFVVGGMGDTSMHVRGAYVHPDTLALLGVKPVVGRLFRRHENEPGRRVAIVSHHLWREHFGASADAARTSVTIDGERYAIVGVMPDAFQFPSGNQRVDIWTTFATDREPYPSGAPAFSTRRDGHYLYVLGRLKRGVTAAEAEADLNSIAADLARAFPATNGRFASTTVRPWLAEVTRGVRPALFMLTAAALCVLAVACMNVANLLLARGTTRQREIAVRSALGAGRQRILRQLLTESLLLATLGGGAGLVLALVGTKYLVTLLPPSFPRVAEIAPHSGVLAFTLLVSVATSCLFGFGPAWRAARSDLAPLLNDCSRGAGETPRGRRTRSVLVVTEMVLAFVLLAGACCLIQAVWRLQKTELGFNPRNLLTASASITYKNGRDGRSYAEAFYPRLAQRIASISGVQSVSGVYPSAVPEPQPVTDFGIEGRPMAKQDQPRAEAHVVLPNYFATMQIPIKRGRDFSAADSSDAPPVVIINETLAREHFGDENPIGKWIKPSLSASGHIVEREIIAVVGGVKPNSLVAAQMPELYVPHAQCATYNLSLLVRTEAAPMTVVSALIEAAAELDEQLPLFDIFTIEDKLAISLAQPRLSSVLLSIFAAVAVVLTAIGVYGVMAYSAAQRQHEIGIRLALGAQKLAVFRLVLAEGLRLIGFAVIGGGLCTLAALPILSRFANGSESADAATLILVALLLSGVALVACWVPAKRAAELDPLVALGHRP
jgi:putative ABC transport system permease protein